MEVFTLPYTNLPPSVSPIERICRCLNPALSAGLTGLDPAAWDSLVVTAIALGLAPLLHWRLEQAGLKPPPLALAKLAVTRQAHARRNEEIARQLADILAACASRHIPALVLKGALLAATVYPDPALRPMNDIDLLFRPADLPAVAGLLEELGYQGKHKDAGQGPGVVKHLSTYRRPGGAGATPNPYLSAGADRTVEPHGSLEESWFGLRVDITPGVWDRAVPLSLHGQPAYRLSAADLVIHLAVHAAFHVIMGTTVFVQLYDLGRVLLTWPAEVEWPQVLHLSRAAGAQPFVYAGLAWAAALYNAPVPAGPLAELARDCPPGLAAYIAGLDAPGLLRRTQQPPLVSLGQRLRRGLLDRREAARWAGSLGQQWRIWQTALAFYRTDTWTLAQSLTGRFHR